MYPYRALLTLGTLAMTLGVSNTAQASSDVALSFELPPSPQAEAEAAAVAEAAAAPPAPAPPTETLVNAEAPLPIPPGAENPPMAGDNARPAGVYGGLDSITIGAAPSVQALLPPPPPVPDYLQPVPLVTPPPAEPEPSAAAPPKTEQLSDEEIQDQVEFGLAFRERSFEPPQDEAEPASTEVSQPLTTATFTYSWDNFEPLFAGGTESLVAWAVGSAEGTRTPHGHKNPAYYGHVDPGNGVWNMGTFSYQHGARTPEEADDKQLRRLQTQTAQLRQKAQAKGLTLSKEELLNGIDLANQAPLAALDRGGYLDWLQKAHNLGMQGQEAIVWARTRSFIDPDTQRWNAPGLGNNVYSISHDQERRANAIARAIAAFTAQTQIAVAPAPSPSTTPEESGVAALETETPSQPQESLAFGVELSPSAGSGDSNAAIATETETEENTATATIEEDEQVVVLADPVTGLLLPDATTAAEPDKVLASAALKADRPVLSRLSRTLSRVFQGRQQEPAADSRDTAIAAEGAATTDNVAPSARETADTADFVAESAPTSVEPAAIAPSSDESSLSFDAPDVPVSLPEPAQPELDAGIEAQPSAEKSSQASAQEGELPAPATDESSAAVSDESAAAELAAADAVVLEESSQPGDLAEPEAAIEGSVAAAEPAPAMTEEADPLAIEQVSAAEPAPAIAAPKRDVADALPTAPAEPKAPQQSKAPASPTDAFDLSQTLDSLDQFQQQLRQDLGT